MLWVVGFVYCLVCFLVVAGVAYGVVWLIVVVFSCLIVIVILMVSVC